MTIGVLKEPAHETRVSLLAESAAVLVKRGNTVLIESGAGDKAFCSNAEYEKSGAQIKSRNEVLESSNIVLSIHSVSAIEASYLSSGILIGVYQPMYNISLMKDWAAKGITVFSLDMLPRTTRAQVMDVLSSQANIAGYKAVILAAELYPRYFPMFMTSAGTIAPAKMLILGAGVAGLQAVATARRMGAVVEVFDTRPAVKEEVMSLGAKFIEVEGAADASKAGGYAVEQTEEYKQRQQQKIAESVAKADVVITTAQIPGKKAPVLITEEMLKTMRSGSVIIDMAAATGGNTAVTQNNTIVRYHNVTIAGNSHLATTMSGDASKLYGKNILNFLQLILDKEAKLNLNCEDELVKGSCVTHKGEVVHEKVRSLII